MKINELIPSAEESARSLSETISNGLRVACPGIIQNFDPDTQTATIQLALRERMRVSENRYNWVQISPLVDVPIVIPRAGGYVLTMPIKPGDECLVIFSDMCIDAWFAHGGVQNQLEKRRHDLSDSFAILGVWSQPEKISNYSVDSCQLRTESGESCLEITESSINVVSKENIVFSSNQIILDSKDGNGLSSNNFTDLLKVKLEGIADGANKYIHPVTHPPSIIAQDSLNKFVTDSQIANWNDANAKKHTHGNKSVLDGITSALVDAWNSAATHISDAIKHITSAERTLWNTVSNKVDKVTGKGLSTEDYTTAEKNKLVGIENGANNYVHPATHSIDIIIESTTKKVMTSAERTKLSGISASAKKVENSLANGNIKIDGVETIVYTHPSGTNPHGTNKADVGLGNVSDVLQASKAEFDTHNTDSLKHVNSAERTAWNNKLDGSANAVSASKLQTARSIALTGDVTGSVAFDGSANVSITASVADDSHNHIIANVDGLQTALDGKSPISHDHDIIYQKRDNVTGSTVIGWNRIAQSPISASIHGAIYQATGKKPGYHTTLIFSIGMSYGQSPTINVLSQANYSAGSIKAIRIVRKSTYDQFFVELDCESGVSLTIEQLTEISGMTLITPTVGSIPTGYVTTELTLVNKGLQSSLDMYVNTNKIYHAGDFDPATFATKAEIGQAGYGDMMKSVYDPDGDGKVSGAVLADSAIKLQTARTINGVSFDGTANITVSDDTKLKQQNGLASNTVYVHRDVVAYNNGSSSVTGMMKIRLPGFGSTTMLNIEIDGYDYSSTTGAWKLIIGGYNYNGSNWINFNAEVIGNPPFSTIRLGHDGVTNCIFLGVTSTVWRYSKVAVTKVVAGHNYPSIWGSGWSITMLTSETGCTFQQTPKFEQVLTTTDKEVIDNTINQAHNHSTVKLNKDSNGIFTEVQLKRADGKLYAKSVLSGGTSPQYTTRTEIEYEANGTTVKATRVWSITYDSDGDIVSENMI